MLIFKSFDNPILVIDQVISKKLITWDACEGKHQIETSALFCHAITHTWSVLFFQHFFPLLSPYFTAAVLRNRCGFQTLTTPPSPGPSKAFNAPPQTQDKTRIRAFPPFFSEMTALNGLLRAGAAVRLPTAAARRWIWSLTSSEADAHQGMPGRRDPGSRNVQWVFLGSPGVGKGTYASRLSQLLGVPHIATGDLVREELASSGPLAQQVVYRCFFVFFLLI